MWHLFFFPSFLSASPVHPVGMFFVCSHSDVSLPLFQGPWPSFYCPSFSACEQQKLTLQGVVHLVFFFKHRCFHQLDDHWVDQQATEIPPHQWACIVIMVPTLPTWDGFLWLNSDPHVCQQVLLPTESSWWFNKDLFLFFPFWWFWMPSWLFGL